MLALASCSKTQTVNTYSYSLKCYTLVTSTDGQTAPFVTQTTYGFSFEAVSAKAEFSSNLQLPDGKSGDFVASDIPFMNSIYQTADQTGFAVYEFQSVKPAMTSGSQISNVKCFLTSGFYEMPSGVVIPGLQGVQYYSPYPNIVFNIDGYYARSFRSDVCFKGKTVAIAHGQEQEPNTDMVYRVVMDLSDASAYKADLYLVNAQLATGMPKITIALKGLDLKFTNAGYTISGTNVAAGMVEGSAITPQPSYTFDSINFEVQSDRNGFLAAAKGSYSVGGRFSATFTEGSCNMQGVTE